MTYFKNFGLVTYDYTIKSDISPVIETVTDLMQRVQLKISDSDLDILCTPHIIKEGETPEKISFNLYNTPIHHWTILYVNRITSFYDSWPMTELALINFCTKKYGNKVNGIHHTDVLPWYITMDKQFIIDNYGADKVLEVTNYDFETKKNELKRFIRVIHPTKIAGFVDAFKREMIRVNG